ncbi:hypothetical protein DRH27_06135 [Candidatus Falkowbacteria bacterium]|nr:MAG: hypothetical protein DRH27_06135 [Candidatus Falkowbacteria bacterium]
MADDLSQDLEVTEVAPEDAPKKPAKGTIATDEVANPALKDYFNMDNVSDTTGRKFGDILEYFGDKPEGVGEMMYMLRQLENRLESPRIGENRLDVVHRYIKVKNEMSDREKELDSFLR